MTMRRTVRLASGTNRRKRDPLTKRQQPLASPHSLVGGAKADFVHLCCLILEGRSDEQKGRLADALVRAASAVLPQVAAISCEVRDMDPAAYAKRAS